MGGGGGRLLSYRVAALTAGLATAQVRQSNGLIETMMDHEVDEGDSQAELNSCPCVEVFI